MARWRGREFKCGREYRCGREFTGMARGRGREFNLMQKNVIFLFAIPVRLF